MDDKKVEDMIFFDSPYVKIIEFVSLGMIRVTPRGKEGELFKRGDAGFDSVCALVGMIDRRGVTFCTPNTLSSKGWVVVDQDECGIKEIGNADNGSWIRRTGDLSFIRTFGWGDMPKTYDFDDAQFESTKQTFEEAERAFRGLLGPHPTTPFSPVAADEARKILAAHSANTSLRLERLNDFVQRNLKLSTPVKPIA